jgi:hypothetical protein
MSKVLIATPAYGGNCSILYAKCLVDLTFLLQSKGHETSFVDVSNESLINRARNTLTQIFLSKDFDYLLFIDADQGFSAPGVLRMLEEDVDVIGAAVPLKQINWPKVIDAISNGKTDVENYTGVYNVNVVQEQLDAAIPGEKVEVNNVGTGIMLIKRHVFEQMIPITPYYLSNQPINKDTIIYNFWSIEIDETNRLLSEDYYFCQKWKSLGGKVYVAPYVGVTHMGTYPFK